MMSRMSVFKAYDVRAVYPEPLNEEIARNIGVAAARLLVEEAGEQGAIVVGHAIRSIDRCSYNHFT